MKKILNNIISIALAAVILVMLCSCAKPDIITEPVIPEGYTEYPVRDFSGNITQGYGAQIDTHMYKSYNSLTQEEQQLYYDRAVNMNIQNIRTQVFPEWYERANDNEDYNIFNYESPNVDMNSAEMQQLWRLFDFCEEKGIKVDLSFYGCNTLYSSEDGQISGTWLGAPFTNHWITAPKIVDENDNAFEGYKEFAESVYALLNYIIEEKGYTCVNEFSVYPEPNLSFVLADGTVSHNEYVKLVKEVDNKLKAEGIRDEFLFSGPATATTTIQDFNRYVTDLGDVFDRWTLSTYRFDGNDTNDTFRDFAEGFIDMVKDSGKTIGIAEFGSKNYTDPANQTDIDTYERALYLARYMVELTNQGFTDMKYWVLGDVMYGNYLMRLGLWNFREFDFAARPQYYTWSLICKYSEIGSQIYKVDSDRNDICMTALKLPDGNWSYIAVNSSDADFNISMVNYNEGYPKAMNVYEVRESLCDGNADIIARSATINVEGGAINYKLKKNSFVVFSTK